MSDAMLPCFKCGKTLRSVIEGGDNQPYGGTEFTTYGHYGSTFWDSFDGEQLVLNICDECLREHSERLGQQKRYLPVRTDGHMEVGRQWVERPMVPYAGSADDSAVIVEPEEIGNIFGIDWNANIDELRERAQKLANHGG